MCVQMVKATGQTRRGEEGQKERQDPRPAAISSKVPASARSCWGLGVGVGVSHTAEPGFRSHMVSQWFQEPLEPHERPRCTAIEAETEKLGEGHWKPYAWWDVILFVGSTAGMLGLGGPTCAYHGAARSQAHCTNLLEAVSTSVL